MRGETSTHIGSLADRADRLKGYARGMRRKPTDTERMLWDWLRDRQLRGMKFRRQVPVGPHIADFICYEARLIVEVDGPAHEEKRDRRRDAHLAAEGFRVVRVRNEDVLAGMGAVLERIVATACFTPHPAPAAPPSPARGEGYVAVGAEGTQSDLRPLSSEDAP